MHPSVLIFMGFGSGLPFSNYDACKDLNPSNLCIHMHACAHFCASTCLVAA